jgi:hypothetical protein
MATSTLATARAQTELIDDVCALAARIGRDRTRGPADSDELWRLIRLARTLGI